MTSDKKSRVLNWIHNFKVACIAIHSNKISPLIFRSTTMNEERQSNTNCATERIDQITVNRVSINHANQIVNKLSL